MARLSVPRLVKRRLTAYQVLLTQPPPEPEHERVVVPLAAFVMVKVLFDLEVATTL